MKPNNRAQLAGMAGMAGAVLLLIAGIWQVSLGLPDLGGSGPLYLAKEILALLGLAGIAIGILGISWGGGVRGRFGQIGVWLFALGYVLIMLGGIIALFSSTDDNPIFLLFPVGALMMDVGALLTGITVIKDHRWSGWQRFMPFIYAVYLWLVIEIPFVMGFYDDDGPGFTPELFKTICVFFVALAVYTAQNKAVRPQTSALGQV